MNDTTIAIFSRHLDRLVARKRAALDLPPSIERATEQLESLGGIRCVAMLLDDVRSDMQATGMHTKFPHAFRGVEGLINKAVLETI